MTTTVIADAHIDPDRLMFEGVNTDEKPVYTVSEMAKVFFGRTNHWIRWLESNGRMAVVKNPSKDCKVCSNTRVATKGDGEISGPCPKCTIPVGTRRSEKMNGRIYTLGDIEEVAHALAQNQSISGTQLRLTLKMLRAQGEMYGYL